MYNVLGVQLPASDLGIPRIISKRSVAEIWRELVAFLDISQDKIDCVKVAANNSPH